MDDLDILSLISKNDDTVTKYTETNSEICSHPKTTLYKGNSICSECGQLVDNIFYTQEWTYFGTKDNRTSRDPSRCSKTQTAKKTTKGVFKDLEIDISDSIIGMIDQKFNTIINHKQTEKGKRVVVRNNGRKRLVAACMYYVYRDIDDPVTESKVMKMFDLKRKEFTKGQEDYNIVFPEARKRVLYPKDFLSHVSREYDISKYVDDIRSFHETLNKEKMDEIDHSPQNIAAAIVYLWLCRNKDKIDGVSTSGTLFAKKVNISNSTLNNIVNEIS